jgi:hypothetical protein
MRIKRMQFVNLNDFVCGTEENFVKVVELNETMSCYERRWRDEY